MALAMRPGFEFELRSNFITKRSEFLCILKLGVFIHPLIFKLFGIYATIMICFLYQVYQSTKNPLCRICSILSVKFAIFVLLSSSLDD